MAPKGNFKLVGRVKRYLQSDPDCGRVSKPAYQTLAFALEMFVCQLFEGASAVAVAHEDNPRILKSGHLRYSVEHGEGGTLGPLLGAVVADVPEFKPQPGSTARAAARKPKRKPQAKAKPAKRPKREPESSAPGGSSAAAKGDKHVMADVVDQANLGKADLTSGAAAAAAAAAAALAEEDDDYDE